MSVSNLGQSRSVTDGSGDARTSATVFLRADAGLSVDIQTAADGTYRTSLLCIGTSDSGVDIFAERDQVERLHALLGAHLAHLDSFVAPAGFEHS